MTIAPTYVVSVLADGAVVIEERAYGTGAVTRTARGKIGEADLRRLISEFERSNYFSLRERYVSEADGCPEVRTDSSTVTTSIRIGGREKTIQHYWGCQEKDKIYPRSLTELEGEIDEIVGTRKLLYPDSR